MSEAPSSRTGTGTVLPVPQPVMVARESRIVTLTKFLSWLTACLLATAVIISLVSITNERNDLRDQISAQNRELICRAAASIEVGKAEGIRDNLLAQVIIFNAQGDQAGVESLIQPIRSAITEAADALAAQEEALQTCAD